MQRELNVAGIKWIDAHWLKLADIRELLSKYEFHELDVEACLEENQTWRIDMYDDYSFIICHFPKYNENKKVYTIHEINVFLSKDTLITIRSTSSSHIDKIFRKYENIDYSKVDEIKVTSGYILYEIIQVMLEKMFKVSSYIKLDLKKLEDKVFKQADAALIKDIMVKNRSIALLRRIFKPQLVLFKQIEARLNAMYASEMEEYFEDLEDKVQYIVNDIYLLEEYVETIENWFKSLIDIQSNNVMKALTLFSAFMLPLTLVTSFFWMNVAPQSWFKPLYVYAAIIVTWIVMLIISIMFIKKWKI